MANKGPVNQQKSDEHLMYLGLPSNMNFAFIGFISEIYNTPGQDSHIVCLAYWCK